MGREWPHTGQARGTWCQGRLAKYRFVRQEHPKDHRFYGPASPGFSGASPRLPPSTTSARGASIELFRRHFGQGICPERECVMQKPLIGLNADYRAAKKDAPAFSFLCAGYYDAIVKVGGVPIIIPPLDD